jgi:hypothetical protein
MVIRYVFGQMTASATVSGSPNSIGGSLPPIDTGPSDTQVINPPVPAAPPSTTTGPAAVPSGPDANSSSGYGSTGAGDSGLSTTTSAGPETTAPPEAAAPAPASANIVQEAAPISRTPMTLVDTTSIYLILVAGAAVAFFGGTVLRLLGVKLKWTR